MCVFCNGRDASQIRTITYQICENDGKWLVDFCSDATSKAYGFLVLNHHQSTFKD